MQYFQRHKFMPYMAGAGIALLVLGAVACGRPYPTPIPEAGVRLRGSVDCSRSPYPDFYDQVRDVLREDLKGIRQQGDPNYTGIDLVITGPPAGGQEKVVAFDIGLKRDLTPEERARLNSSLASVCPL